MIPNNLEKKFFTIKDTVYIVMLILGMAGTFYVQKGKIDTLALKVTDLDDQLKKNNLELINYKIDNLVTSFDRFSTSFDDFMEEYRKAEKDK